MDSSFDVDQDQIHNEFIMKDVDIDALDIKVQRYFWAFLIENQAVSIDSFCLVSQWDAHFLSLLSFHCMWIFP